MGRLIELTDQDYQYCLDYASGKTNTMALKNINRIIKAVADGTQYENRLKADMVAMLTEIQLEIREHDPGCGWEGYADKNVIDCIIQERINSLEGE